MKNPVKDVHLERLREAVKRPTTGDRLAERERVYRRAQALDIFEPREGSR